MANQKDQPPIFRAKRRLPESPLRVDPLDLPARPPSLRVKPKPVQVEEHAEGALEVRKKPEETALADPLENRQDLAKKTSKVKWGVGIGLALSAATVGGFLLFRMLNRMKVEGLENIPESHENVLYCPNHSSLLDNFALGVGLYIPRMFFNPEYIPINLADRKNFFGDPASRRFKDRVLRILGEYFFKNLRTFPVDRGKGGLEQVEQWVEMLKSNIVIVFPEGTRSRTGEIGRGKAGVGKMIYDARPTVVPIRLMGTDEVLGVGTLVPNVFRTVRIVIGKPIDLNELMPDPLPEDPKEQLDYYRGVANRVVEAIRNLTPGQKLPFDQHK